MTLEDVPGRQFGSTHGYIYILVIANYALIIVAAVLSLSLSVSHFLQAEAQRRIICYKGDGTENLPN